MSFYNNKNAVRQLSLKIEILRKDFLIEDDFKSRKERNWEKFDRLNEIEKLHWRIAELSDYLNITPDDEEFY